MGAGEVKAFLTWLAVHRHVAVNTQKVALNAVVFLYHKMLKQELGEMDFRLASEAARIGGVTYVQVAHCLVSVSQTRDL